MIPTIIGNNKPELATCISTFIGLVVITLSYFALGLVSATVSNSLNLIAWGIVMIQVICRRVKNG
jgi:hypothetical protein